MFGEKRALGGGLVSLLLFLILNTELKRLFPIEKKTTEGWGYEL